MGKRFIDSKLWTDSWFRQLSPDVKLFWVYLFSACDNAGVWEVDFELSNILLRLSIDESIIEALNQEKKRIRPIKNGKYWFIEDFIGFQYGELSDSCHPHKKVKELLKDHAITLESRVVTTLQEKEEEEYKDKTLEESEKPLPGFNQLEAFNEFFEKYPARGRLKRSASLRFYCETVINRDIASRILKALQNYSANLKANDWKNPQECPNWLEEWFEWENHKELVSVKREKKRNPDCQSCNESGKLPDGKGCWCVS